MRVCEYGGFMFLLFIWNRLVFKSFKGMSERVVCWNSRLSSLLFIIFLF